MTEMYRERAVEVVALWLRKVKAEGQAGKDEATGILVELISEALQIEALACLGAMCVERKTLGKKDN